MKGGIAAVITFGALASLGANANVDAVKELAKCSADTNGVKRLACFDDLAKRAGALPQTKPVQGKGKWVMQETTNKIDDSKTITAVLSADSAITGWPRKTHIPRLFMRCMSSKTEVFVENGMSSLVEYRSGEATITVRFDKDKAKQLAAEKSTDGEALFIPSPIQFLKEAEKKTTMLYEFTPFNSGSVMTTFQLAGIEEVVKAIRATCKW